MSLVVLGNRLYTDITPIQLSWVPQNDEFKIDDANQNWTWLDNTFDFVHVRFLTGCTRVWNRFYRAAYHCLKPGGRIEY